MVFAKQEILGALGERPSHVAPTNEPGVNSYIVEKLIDIKTLSGFHNCS